MEASADTVPFAHQGVHVAFFFLHHQMKQLTRKEPTHRLCTRGAMLESFLIRPEVLTDDDVMDILKQAFSQTGMKEVAAESG